MADILTGEHVCAGGESGKDTCEIDIGGAVWYDDDGSSTVYALTNAGGELCDGTIPGVYTRVSYHLKWLYEVTGGAVGSSVTEMSKMDKNCQIMKLRKCE